MDLGLADQNSEMRDLFLPVENFKNIDQADLVEIRDTKREQQINVESHETVSQPDEDFLPNHSSPRDSSLSSQRNILKVVKRIQRI